MKKIICLVMMLSGMAWGVTPLVGPNYSPYNFANTTYTLTDQAGQPASLVVNTLTVTGAASLNSGSTQVGAVTQSTTTFTGAASFYNITAAQELTLQSTATGQIVFCTNCTGWNAAKGGLCQSTGTTTVDQFIAVSTFTALTVCQ